MAPPPFLGPFRGNRNSALSVRNWIVQNVPCPVGHVPTDWTYAIFTRLRQYYVDPPVILNGMSLARADGYIFDYDVRIPIPVVISPVITVDRNPPPTMGVPSESPKEAQKHVVEVLEYEYEKAVLNNDYAKMKRLAKQFADLLNKAEPIDEEIQWGAPLLRRSVRRMADGSDPVPRGAGGGPYRPLYVPVNVMEGQEGEAEGD
jgi:hypothetical protein